MSDSLIRKEMANNISEKVRIFFEVIGIAHSDIEIKICRHVTVVFEKVVTEKLLHKNEVWVVGGAAIS